MRKLTLNLEALNVESFHATPHRTSPESGTVRAHEAVPYTLDMAYPECLDCELSRTCPSLDPAACRVDEITD